MKEYLQNNFDLSKLPEVYDELPFWSAPFGIKLLDAVEYRENISALDIGLGTGFPLTELAMRLGPTCKVFGIDPWAQAFERVQKKIEYYKINNTTLIKGEAESIPLKNNSINLIVSNNGINNVKNIDLVIKECSRVIVPGGQFVMTMNLNKTMIEFYSLFEQILFESRLKDNIIKLHNHIYEKRKPVDEITSSISKNGFTIKSQIFDSFSYKFSSGTAMLNHYFIRLAFLDSWIKIVPTDKIESIFNLIESRLNKQAIKDSGINLSIPFIMINSIMKK